MGNVWASKSETWDVSDDKKAAEEVPGQPSAVDEGQVTVVGTHEVKSDDVKVQEKACGGCGDEPAAVKEERPAGVTSHEDDVDNVTSHMQKQCVVNDPADTESDKVVASDKGEGSCHDVEIVWEHGGSYVSINGSFNDWQDAPLHLIDGVHKATFSLPRGRHLYKYVVDGDIKTDPFKEDDGEGHNVITV